MKVVRAYFGQNLKCFHATPTNGITVEVLTLPDACDPLGRTYEDLVELSQQTALEEYLETQKGT